MNDKSLTEILVNLDHLGDYLALRTDIMANDPNRWLNTMRLQLPTFDYYLEKCVKDKGGKYDFTVRRYGNMRLYHDFGMIDSLVKKQVVVCVELRYSMWMGTPFNYEKKIYENNISPID